MMIQHLANKREYMLEEAHWPVDVVDGSIALSRELSHDNSDKYAFWIARAVMRTIQTTGINSFAEFMQNINVRKDLGYIVDWVNSLEQNTIWTQELSEQANEIRAGYQTNETVCFFKDGWRIVEVTSEDMENELDLFGNTTYVKHNIYLLEHKKSRFFSLRDPSNQPHALIETTYFLLPQEVQGEGQEGYGEPMYIKDMRDVEELEPEESEKIYEWFRLLSSKGVKVVKNDDDDVDLEQVQSLIEKYEQNGMVVDLNLGDYDDEIERITQASGNTGREGLIVSNAMNDFEGLVAYAIHHEELDKLDSAVQNFEIKAQDDFSERFEQYVEPEMENRYPDEDDYTERYIPSPAQPEFSGGEFENAKNLFFDKPAYDEAMRLYEVERDNLERHYMDEDSMLQFAKEMKKSVEFEKKKKELQEQTLLDEINTTDVIASKVTTLYRGEGSTSKKGGNYWTPSRDWAAQFTQTGEPETVRSTTISEDDIYTPDTLPYAGDLDAIDEAVLEAQMKGFKAVRLDEGQNEPPSVYVFDKTALSVMASEKLNMIKTAKTKTPTHEEVVAYVESLKLHAKRGTVSPKVKEVIDSMPSVRRVEAELSEEEDKVLFESIRWAWKEITGSDIVESLDASSSPETLEGNYWMVNNGVLLHGSNHFTIVRNNLDLFARLLNIDPFVLHQKLASRPEQMIRLIIAHGGMRIFATKDRRIYCQLSPETYSRWGGSKIRKLDFSTKTVRLVGKHAPYSGWKSGVTILL